MKQVLALCVLAVCCCAFAADDERGYIEETGFSWSKTGPIVPGDWTGQASNALAIANAEGIPVIAFYGRRGCENCQSLETLFVSESVSAKFKQRKYILLAGIEGEKESSTIKNYCKKGTTLPYLGLYWVDRKGQARVDNQKVRKGPGLFGSEQELIDWVESYFGEFKADLGGSFVQPDELGNRLECEAKTGVVNVNLERYALAAYEGLSVLTIAYPNGTTETTNLVWAAGEDKKSVAVDMSVEKAGFQKDGDQVAIYLAEAGVTVATNHITYVDVPVSSRNPLWLDERDETNPLQFGEWTMDLATATNKAAKADGEAYTLVMVSGSCWCPNCTNFESNVLTVDRDETGKSRFERWAAANNVALVEIDVGRFMSGADEKYPTLLSKELGKSGFYPSGTASGLGYLTRKGISDELAEEVYARNCELAKTYAVDGGYFGPEDLEDKNCTPYRPRVPCFCLLRKDGTCATRLTRFSFKTTPTGSDQAYLDSYIARFDEMLAIAGKGKTSHEDLTELANDYPGAGSVPLAAFGGSASAELCCADLRDTYRLDGFGGNGNVKLAVKNPESAANVTLTLWEMKEGGPAKIQGAAKSGKLDAGVELDFDVTTSGEYYVQVMATKVAPDAELDPEFSAKNPAMTNFVGYAITSDVTLVPAESQVTARAAAGSDTVKMRLENGGIYRLAGLKSCAQLTPLSEAPEGFFVATDTGNFEVTLAAAGGEIAYQRWAKNDVGFDETARTVSESVCATSGKPLEFTVSRTGGVSGVQRVKVEVNLEETTLKAEDDAHPRFELLTDELVWEDGDATVRIVKVNIIDYDNIYYGEGDVVIDLKPVDPEWGCGVAEGRGRLVIGVTEDDRRNPGKTFFSRADPHYAKAKTVYVREGETGTVYLVRTGGSDGRASAVLKSSVAGVSFAAAKASDLEVDPDDGLLHFYWENHETAEKPLYVSGVPAGKTAKVSLTAYNRKGTPTKEKFAVLSSSNAVSVVGVAADAPTFAQATSEATVYRYVAVSNFYAVTDVQGGELSFKKLSGSLPAGLKATWEKDRNGLVISGVPTSNDKTGKTYVAFFQVSEKRLAPGAKKPVVVPGLTTEIRLTVVDPAADGTGAGGVGAINASCVKSRTFKDLMVLREADNGTVELQGLLQLTLPATGKASAKLASADGTVSFSAKGWNALDWKDGAGDGRLTCLLAGTTAKTKSQTIAVTANADGSIVAEVRVGSDELMPVRHEGVFWSKDRDASDCRGTYTVTLADHIGADGYPDISGEGKALATRGSAYLILTMNSSSQYKAGTMKWAGLLPNGTAVSGSSTLTEADEESVDLPYLKVAGKDAFAGVVRIARGASERVGKASWESVGLSQAGGGDVLTRWTHSEKSKYTEKGDYSVRFVPYGGIYDKTVDLANCCEDQHEGRGTSDLVLTIDLPADSDFYGPFVSIDSLGVKVGSSALKLTDSTGGTSKVKLSLNRTNGLVSGTFKLFYGEAGKSLSATFKGVVQLGYGDGCGCGEGQPFVNGTWSITDKIAYPAGTVEKPTVKYLSVKRGAGFRIDTPEP